MTPRPAAAVLACTLLSSCVVVPVTVAGYDPDCRIITHHMELKARQDDPTIRCGNSTDSPACRQWLGEVIVTAAGSAIVSGSIVVVGNVIYWAEERVGCQGPGKPVEAGAASP